MMHRLSRIGAAAHGPNRWCVWSIPPRIAATQIIGMNGSITITSLSEYARSGLSADIMTAASSPSSITMVIIPVTSASRPIVSDANASALEGSSSLSLVYSGMNAADSAPSPNNLRNIFGIANAAANAEPTAVSPNTRTVTKSLAMPSTREISVNPATVRVLRPSD